MNTFLPYDSFELSAKCLDYRRLGKQRVEAKQILNILLNRTPSNAWRNHPCTKMWQGYEEALKLYYNIIVNEWKRRGYKNNMKMEVVHREKLEYPKWFGEYNFHSAMRSNLLRKNFAYYSCFGWKEPITLPYIWGNK